MGAADVKSDAQVKSENILSNSKVSVVALGGTASNAMEPITNGLAGIKNYLQNGLKYNQRYPGVPFAHTLKFLPSMTARAQSMEAFDSLIDNLMKDEALNQSQEQNLIDDNWLPPKN